MDKFAVDLEKVLDEFEYNEGREEAVVPSVIKNSLQHISQKPVRPPAASYRRPAFEPINLADADFSAAPIAVTHQLNSIVKPNKHKEQFTKLNNSKEHNDLTEQSEFENDNQDENAQGDGFYEEIQNTLENRGSTASLEDTPDLLDSNSLKPTQNNLSNNSITELNTQLPDITTSIRSTPVLGDTVDQIEQPVFDLIKQHTTSQILSQDELPPVVDVGTVIKEAIPQLNLKPISFSSMNDVPDSELVEYLQCLEELELIGGNEEGPNSERVSEAIEECTESAVNDLDERNEVVKSENVEVNSLESSYVCEENDFVAKESSSEETSSEVNLAATEEIQYLGGDHVLTSDKEEIIANVSIPPCQLDPPCNDADLHSDEISCQDSGDFGPNYSNSTIDSVDENQRREHAEAIGTENEEIENCQNEEKAVLHREEVRDTPDNFAEQLSGSYFNSENSNPDAESRECDQGKPSRPNSLALPSHIVTDSEESPTPTGNRANSLSNMLSPEERSLGKVPPFWVPDTEADSCMQCHSKFTVIKRRHHCRACGLLLCSKCCGLKAPLEYMEFQEARVCQPCYNIIYRVSMEEGRYNLGRQPNPNNPMEYCSTVPPLQQAATALLQPPPSVLVPTGVLKREGRAKSDVPKQVIFSDGIRPGGDLTELDGAPESRLPPRRGVRRIATPPGGKSVNSFTRRPLNTATQSFIPTDPTVPPPAVTIEQGQLNFFDDVSKVTDQPVKFAINYNLFVNVKRIKLDCCVNRECWSICSEGLACMGQDEIAMVLECLPDELLPPQDVFNLINTLHQDASKGTAVNEMCFTPAFTLNLLGSKDHGGFLYIRPTLQCTTQLLLPSQPYLIAILVHRWETPWARLFPLRLILRLGAEYRYYPTPLVSIRNRPPLYTDIGHTIMKILVDFRKYSYSLATVRGLVIHMEDRQTTILFPRNRYDQVVKALNNSNDSVLAFGANLSLKADSHLVCIQGTQDENTYYTQAINIHNKPRKVTGTSFVVFKGALKTAGLSGKSTILEDGIMVHLPSDSMVALRNALKEMQDYSISCGPNDEETVLLKWTEDDTNFNIGVRSCIDGRPLDGVPSIRVHNGTDYPGHSRIIRWTEVFILQCEEGNKANDPLDISKVSESLARATCVALVPVLDLLAESNLTTLAIRAAIHPDNVGYEAGSGGEKFPPQYMKRLDDELIQVVHQAAVSSQDTPAVLELVFRIMNHP